MTKPKADLERLMAGLPRRTVKELCALRLKATEMITQGERLGALKDAIDDHLLQRVEVPEDGWTAGAQEMPRFRMRAGQKLAVVFRVDTHGIGKGEYGIEVLGETLSEYPRHVDEAKETADAHLLAVKAAEDE